MISEAGATLRVARLERLLERVRMNTAKPRIVTPRVVSSVSAASVSRRADEPEIDYDDFADAEVVEIDVDEASMAPAVPVSQPRTSASPTAYSMRFVDDGLPDGIAPLTEGGESMAHGVVSTNPPAEEAFALQSPLHSEPPTWQAGASQPTMEQLGNTIGLESGGQGPDLELDVQSVPPTAEHDLEVSLPTRGFAGGYDEGLAAPDTAQHDLAQYSQTSGFGGGSLESGSFDSASNAPAFDAPDASGFDAPGFDAPAIDAAGFDDGAAVAEAVQAPEPVAASAGAHVVQRSAVNPAVPVVEIVDSRRVDAQSFMALLDESISLNDK